MKTVYCLQVHHSHGTALSVVLNGIPVYDGVMGPNEARSTTTSPD